MRLGAADAIPEEIGIAPEVFERRQRDRIDPILDRRLAGRRKGGDPVCEKEPKLNAQWCFDAVRQRPTGGASQSLIHWINRPTYQQANEIPRRLPR